MKTKMTVLLVLLITGASQIACELSLAGQPAAATQAAADSFATLTAQAPTGTPTYTPSPTATTTATATATSTSTAKPTSTSTVTPTATPQWMGAGLVLEDLPDGFQPMPGEELDAIQESLPQNALAFGFGDEANGQVVMGYYMPVQSRDVQIVFDESLQDTVDYLASTMGATTKRKPIHVDGDVGVSRLATTFVSEQGGMDTRIDMMLFRRGEVAAFLFVIYPNGNKPAVHLTDLAQLLDGRIQAAYEALP
jgi:hypothetical protein